MATFLTKLVQEGHLLGKACPRRKPSWQSLSKEVTFLAKLVGLGKACPRSSAWLCFRLREFEVEEFDVEEFEEFVKI